MQFGFEIYPEHRAILVRCAGNFTMEDLLSTPRRIWADPRYSPDFAGLVEITDASLRIDMNDLRTLTTFLAREPATSRAPWAAVTDLPVAIACSFVYRKAMRRRHAFEVFSSREAACNFLKLDPAIFASAGPPAAA
ncbi:MAG TPA: hypothetical protein VL200_07500 [Lacunisphaera sp.]|jgi:hypothetical protein|nr:hypothetical protein [Lacunisphaera sp.]